MSAAILSVAVVWSEVTFFNKSQVLSLFALFVNIAKEKYDYFTIEVNVFLDDLMSLVLYENQTNFCYCTF